VQPAHLEHDAQRVALRERLLHLALLRVRVRVRVRVIKVRVS